MENRSYALATGVFILALLALGWWLLQIWPQQGRAASVTYQIISHYPVSGLNLQAPVKYRGVPIGKVDNIRFDPRDHSVIIIDIGVDAAAPVGPRTVAQLGFLGVTGLSYIELTDLETDMPRAPHSIPMQESLLSQAGNAGQSLMLRLDRLAEKMTQVLERMDTPQNRQHLDRTLSNLESASAELLTLQAALKPTLKRLPQLADNASATLTHIDTLSQDLGGLSQQASASLGRLDQASQSFVELGQRGQQLSQHIDQQALPALQNLLVALSDNSQQFGQVLKQVQNDPRSLVFGKITAPGPGEAGFKTP